MKNRLYLVVRGDKVVATSRDFITALRRANKRHHRLFMAKEIETLLPLTLPATRSKPSR